MFLVIIALWLLAIAYATELAFYLPGFKALMYEYISFDLYMREARSRVYGGNQ